MVDLHERPKTRGCQSPNRDVWQPVEEVASARPNIAPLLAGGATRRLSSPARGDATFFNKLLRHYQLEVMHSRPVVHFAQAQDDVPAG